MYSKLRHGTVIRVTLPELIHLPAECTGTVWLVCAPPDRSIHREHNNWFLRDYAGKWTMANIILWETDPLCFEIVEDTNG